MEKKTVLQTREKKIACRVKKSIMRKLQAEATLEKISLSQLLHRIISDYAEWDINAVRAGWLVFMRSPLRDLLDHVDDKTLSKIATRAADNTRYTRIVLAASDSVSGFITVLKKRSRKSGFVINKSKEKGFLVYTVHHEMGRKWSMFHKIMYERILNNVGHGNARIEYTDDTLKIKIKNTR